MKERKRWNPVFCISAVIAILITVCGFLPQDALLAATNRWMSALKDNFSWLYLTVMLFFVVFLVVLAVCPWGKTRLGQDGEKPEYSTVSWFAMLFGAGMGIGLVFWSVAEPLAHYINPANGIESQSAESAAFAIRSSFMHWGVHPWASYAIIGLALAYVQFRKKKTALISNVFEPMLGKQSRGAVGKGIDIFTTVLTVVGVATSFGMGCLQISCGLHYLFGIPDNIITWLILIVVVCFIYLKSAISGVGNGIKKLSDLNLILFLVLMITAFCVGPTKDIVTDLAVGLRDYVIHFIPDSLRLTYQGDDAWIKQWRVFYWAWWISWAPFVGVFIARISKGRTIRQFVFGVMLVPTIVSVLWFAVFGGMAIDSAGNFSTAQLAGMVNQPQTALYHIFSQYPLGIVLSVIAMALLVTFFVTSANSATFVLAMLTSEGQLEPPNSKKTFWGILIAGIALVLILSGGIEMIQTVAVIIAFPYLFILVLIAVCCVLWLRKKE